MTCLKPSDFEDFWIRVYLNPNNDLKTATANRAYRDLNRTIHGLSKVQRQPKYHAVRKVLMEVSENLIYSDFNSQSEFDESHESKCYLLIKSFKKEYRNIPFSIGQAQKWINMNLKYLFALGENRVPGISKNYMFFHIPLDNIIQDQLLKNSKIKRIPIAWSRIIEYEMYIDYQKEVRSFYYNKVPMDVEFRLFNGDGII